MRLDNKIIVKIDNLFSTNKHRNYEYCIEEEEAISADPTIEPF